MARSPIQGSAEAAEYVEHVMRFKRRLVPSAPPLRLGQPALDAMAVREPDLAIPDPLNAQIIAERPTEAAEVFLLEKSYRHRPKT